MPNTLQPAARDSGNPAEVRCGQILAYRYELLSEAGKGGSSTVYRAYDRRKGEYLAIKHLTLSPKLTAAEREMRIERFQQEARTLALLDHPQIISVWDLLEINGEHFMLMEWLEGHPLKTWTQQEQPRPRALLQLLFQLADALEYLHSKYIVHRDIKPENVMVMDDGSLRLLDFGIAKLQGYNQLTLDGTILGTVTYMSPEQLQNSRGSNYQSDIYSLGVLMYELFTGKLPFDADSPGTAIIQIFSQEARPPLELNPHLGADLNQLILTCLHKYPQHRFASCRQIQRIIQLLLERVFPQEETETAVVASLMPRIRMFANFKLYQVVERLKEQSVSGKCWLWNANQEAHLILDNGQIVAVDIKNKRLAPQTVLCDLLSWESGNLMFIPGKGQTAHSHFDSQSQEQLWSEASDYLSGFRHFWDAYRETDIPELIREPGTGEKLTPIGQLLFAWIDGQRSIGELYALMPQDRLAVARNLKELEDRQFIFVDRLRPEVRSETL